MPIQLNDAGVDNGTFEVFLRSLNYPLNNMVSTRAPLGFMTWLKAPSSVWNTPGRTASIVGGYDQPYDIQAVTGIQIGTQQDNDRAPNVGTGNGIMVWTTGGIVLVSTSPLGQGVITPYNPPADTWFHVAYTCDAFNGTNQTHYLYVNGVLMAQATHALQNGGVLTTIILNGYSRPRPDTYTETTNCEVDDVRYYNRKLQASEILTIYNSRGARDGIVDGLVAHFTFDEGIGGQPISTIFDVSGSVNNLVVQNYGGPDILYTAPSVTASNTRPPHI